MPTKSRKLAMKRPAKPQAKKAPKLLAKKAARATKGSSRGLSMAGAFGFRKDSKSQSSEKCCSGTMAAT